MCAVRRRCILVDPGVGGSFSGQAGPGPRITDPGLIGRSLVHVGHRLGMSAEDLRNFISSLSHQNHLCHPITSRVVQDRQISVDG